MRIWNPITKSGVRPDVYVVQRSAVVRYLIGKLFLHLIQGPLQFVGDFLDLLNSALIFTTNKTGDLIVEAEDVQANEDWPGENAKLGQDFRTDFDENVVALGNRNFKKDCQL